MAKAQAAAKAGTDKQTGFGRKVLIILLAALLVAVLAVGGLFTMLLMNQGDDGNDGESSTASLASPPAFVELDPFVVNLRRGDEDRNERYLRTEIALRASSEETAEKLENYLPEIRHRINLMLSARSPRQLSDGKGREELAEAITEAVNEVLGVPPEAAEGSHTPVRSVLFNSFIIQ